MTQDQMQSSWLNNIAVEDKPEIIIIIGVEH